MAKRDRYQVSLKALLKNKEGHILGLKGVSSGTMAGFFDLPGGRINDDEFDVPFLDIVEREIREECGDVTFTIKPKPVAIGRHLIPGKLYGKPEDIHVLYVLFEADLHSGDITISDEHAGHEWLEPSAVRSAPESFFNGGNLQAIRMYLS